MENIPTEGPVLLVGNHSLVAIDVLVFDYELLRRHGRVARGMGDDALMRIPPLRAMVHKQGSVRGSRRNCRTLLALGEAVFVLPGGANESFYLKAEKYALKWEGRTGFAQMAIEAGVPIVPVTMVGANDAFEVVLDGDHPLMRPLRRLAERQSRPNLTPPPLFHGIGPTLIPRPQRLYFAAGAPIDATQWRDKGENAAAELQSVVRDAMNAQFDFLLAEQAADPGRTLLGRVRGALARWRS
jgi:1-acyl-sn-glycerol-3-phosphate acyltransferase